jgi:hypothetical protein
MINSAGLYFPRPLLCVLCVSVVPLASRFRPFVLSYKKESSPSDKRIVATEYRPRQRELAPGGETG